MRIRAGKRDIALLNAPSRSSPEGAALEPATGGERLVAEHAGIQQGKVRRDARGAACIAAAAVLTESGLPVVTRRCEIVVGKRRPAERYIIWPVLRWIATVR